MKTLFFLFPLFLCAAGSSGCSEEMLFRFFPEPFVKEALEAEGVSNEQAEAVAKDLVRRDRDIVRRIEERAATRAVNPIQDPKLRDERAALFREVIREIFADSLSREGIVDDAKADRALEAIQKRRLELFENCRQEGALSP